MKPRPHRADESEYTPETDEESSDGIEPNHSLDHGRKAEARYYGDDPDAGGEDANLSALFAELGAEDRLDEVGL